MRSGKQCSVFGSDGKRDSHRGTGSVEPSVGSRSSSILHFRSRGTKRLDTRGACGGGDDNVVVVVVELSTPTVVNSGRVSVEGQQQIKLQRCAVLGTALTFHFSAALASFL